ncbi:MAG: protein translocase subunit SecD [Kofleriaceae bacterium]|nr:protein translocase subunit SecD [Kofleriaceae bacterium]
MNLGLDLQGGLHLVYSIDLDKAVDDKASEIRRDLESKFADEKANVEVKTPVSPLGAVTLIPADASKKAELTAMLKSDFKGIVEMRACAATDAANAICAKVSADYADGIKKAALANAVITIRERIDEKGIAEPTVVEKGDEVIVELPGLDEDKISETKEIIKRTAKLEFKVVDNNAPYMNKLYAHVVTDNEAKALDIVAEIDGWVPENGGGRQEDKFLIARDREEAVPLEEARRIEKCWNKDKPVKDGKMMCMLEGRFVIERYVRQLAAKDPSFVVPDDHQLGFEFEQPNRNAQDTRPYWRSYYLERAVRLTGSAVSNAMTTYDPTTNRPVVRVDFNRYGGRVFGDLTAQVQGHKVATILDGKIKSAPIINAAIRGGTATITMGGGDPMRQEADANDLVTVLKSGSLPAPLKEESASTVGATLGQDAIDKTKLSFGLGIVLVIIIMVGIYKFSGVISVVSVVMNMLLMMTAIVLFGATLTLPGVAALVLTVGMAVDANILIYERIRDELLLGKSVRGAVDIGFSRAFTAILDGQLTTAAAGLVLYQFGSGPIKGFAVMLLVGICTTLFTNVWASRLLFDWYLAGKADAKTISI